MATKISYPLTAPATTSKMTEQDLDTEIARVRMEIAQLSQRKRVLSSALLSSTKMQAYIRARNPSSSLSDVPRDTTPLAHSEAKAQEQHNLINIHRLAYGVTSFPFRDPNPDASPSPLLGIRFDIPSQSGTFERAPYYLFCKQNSPVTSVQAGDGEHDSAPPDLQEGEEEESSQHVLSESNSSNSSDQFSPTDKVLTIHHHTIPSHIALEDHIRRFLPAQPSRQHPQNLHSLVHRIRNDLISWAQRQDTLDAIADDLETKPELAIHKFTATGPDARFARIIWDDGRVGRVKIGDDGFIERSVVFGLSNERMKETERILTEFDDGRKVALQDLIGRFEEVRTRSVRSE